MDSGEEIDSTDAERAKLHMFFAHPTHEMPTDLVAREADKNAANLIFIYNKGEADTPALSIHEKKKPVLFSLLEEGETPTKFFTVPAQDYVILRIPYTATEEPRLLSLKDADETVLDLKVIREMASFLELECEMLSTSRSTILDSRE